MKPPSRLALFATVAAATAATVHAYRQTSDPLEIEPRTVRPLDSPPPLTDAERAEAMRIVADAQIVRALPGCDRLTATSGPLQPGMFVFEAAVRDRDPIGRSVWVQIRLPKPLDQETPYTWRQLVAMWPHDGGEHDRYQRIWTQDYVTTTPANSRCMDVLVEVHLASRTVIAIEPGVAEDATRRFVGTPRYLHHAA